MTPHECTQPADTDKNEPDGADDSPAPSVPQQTAVPSALTPHEWNEPADTDKNEPDGAVACP